MSSVKKLQLLSNDPTQTEALAERLGRNLKGGEVIELVSDLGGGKTTFVRGLARGMGSTTHVSSPTFKISNVYKTSALELHHFDLYRLNEPGVVLDELAEVLGDPIVVVVIEWGGIVKNVLPVERLTVTFNTTGEDSRELQLTYSPALDYVTNGIA